MQSVSIIMVSEREFLVISVKKGMSREGSEDFPFSSPSSLMLVP